MNVQAVDLHISDDQRPLAGPQTDIQPMDTAEVHHQPPRGEDDPEVAGMPMDAAGNDDFQRYGETHQWCADHKMGDFVKRWDYSS